ncbi:hypothetical protein V496_10004 [Pseudogymnoascus sp. VKM F-4515 (FW-2607)]|nr:hypothetical protein V496_10004 [Pseudogymnoascus sp. VKM F-4515 (FW-2607)]
MSTGLQRQAVRLIRNVTYPETSSILLQVHVKTGVKPPKEDSILSIEEDQIKLQVQSPGVNDRANTAVKLLLSKVLNVPKTNISIIRGDKAHYKSLSVTDYTTSYIQFHANAPSPA